MGILCLVGAIGATVAWRMYHQERSKAADQTTEIQISAKDLYQQYADDEHKADSLYRNKIIEVSGTVASIDNNTQNLSLTLSSDADAMGGINCALSNKQDIPTANANITVKGKCTGFLMDVLLEDATIVKK